MLAKPTTCQCSHPLTSVYIFKKPASSTPSQTSLTTPEAQILPEVPEPHHFDHTHKVHTSHHSTDSTFIISWKKKHKKKAESLSLWLNSMQGCKPEMQTWCKQSDKIGSSGSTVCGGGGVAVASLLALFPVCNINWQHAHCTRSWHGLGNNGPDRLTTDKPQNGLTDDLCWRQLTLTLTNDQQQPIQTKFWSLELLFFKGTGYKFAHFAGAPRALSSTLWQCTAKKGQANRSFMLTGVSDRSGVKPNGAFKNKHELSNTFC